MKVILYSSIVRCKKKRCLDRPPPRPSLPRHHVRRQRRQRRRRRRLRQLLEGARRPRTGGGRQGRGRRESSHVFLNTLLSVLPWRRQGAPPRGGSLAKKRCFLHHSAFPPHEMVCKANCLHCSKKTPKRFVLGGKLAFMVFFGKVSKVT